MPRMMEKTRISPSTTDTLCRYFMHGACTAGSSCRFSHDIKDKPSMVCKYYLQGSCSYGKGCRYDHVKPHGSQPSRSSCPKPVVLNTKDASPQEITMISLKKSTAKKSNGRSSPIPSNWAEAPEFVPGQAYKGLNNVKSEDTKQPPAETSFLLHELDQQDEGACCPPLSYSQATLVGTGTRVVDELTDEEASTMLCPFAAMGRCIYENKCPYLHGLECDMCGRLCLHPYDEEQQKEHRRECLESHERDMEHSFAVQRSEGVTCGVCLEVVKAKSLLSEQRFGVLPNCNHAFCLSCIRKWRTCSSTEKKIIRACPICRTPSGFVIPSAMWYDDPEEKAKLIEEYTRALSSKPCRYFSEGKGTCPFGSSCFYKHAYADGTEAEIQLRRFNTAEGDVKIAKNLRLWDFLEAEENLRR